MNDVCHFYNTKTKKCSEVEGVKRLLKWGVGTIITVFLAAFGYFTHNQDKTHALMLEQTAKVVELKAIITYQILPHLRERKQVDGDKQSSLDRLGDNRDELGDSRYYPTGRDSGD
jgi:hypothetical protein